jgi:DNA recombination protein RmuC
MYIPAENVYYETIIRDDFSSGEKGIMEYTLEKRVIPVSPNSFYAYLQAIVLGLKGLHIEKTARQVMEKLARLNLELKKFRSDFSQLGEHLRKAYNKYGEGERALDRFSDKLLQIEETKQLEEKQN